MFCNQNPRIGIIDNQIPFHYSLSKTNEENEQKVKNKNEIQQNICIRNEPQYMQ